jgi:hypothetical protein
VTPRVYGGRRRSGKNVYGMLIVVMVVVAFVLQFHWMQKVRETGGANIAPNTLAEKLSRWMQRRRGVPLDETKVLGQIGTERIACEACAQTGALFNETGQPVPCAICQGVGFRMVRRFNDADRICPACGGMGRVEMPDTGRVETCPRCEGRGLVQTVVFEPADPAE